ncbi:Clp protease ClpB [Algoriphagus aestuarii]|nr:Clp protease ClpB [Algoriphagus aestuarii]
MIHGLLLLLFYVMPSQLSQAGEAKLERMIQERDALTAEWKRSESKKSGIFGNRTKKDMIETNEWLQRILAKDNAIMDELRMIGDIETTVATQTGEDYKAITLKLEQDLQAVKRALSERDKEIEDMLQTRRTFEWTTTIFFLATLGLGYWIYKIKKGP